MCGSGGFLGSDQLPKKERDELDRLAGRGALRVAAVSLWETQMLHSKGRLSLNRPFDIWIRDAAATDVVKITDNGFRKFLSDFRLGFRHSRCQSAPIIHHRVRGRGRGRGRGR